VNFRSPLRSGQRGALAIRPFRRLWIALSLSSLGDWLSLLALTALALTLTTSKGHPSTAQDSAVGGVWLTSLLPALVLGPLAGAVADRFDRRMNMIVGDVVRAVLYLTIPLNLAFGFVDKLTWIYIVQFLASCASLFWTPAKDASVPNLVPPDQLENANQLSLLTTFGTAPVAGLLFGLFALISSALGSISHFFRTDQVDLALFFNVATFVVSALTVAALKELPRRRASGEISAPSVAKTIREGWRFIGQSEVVRGIMIGMVGAFAAGGVVVGLGPAYVKNTLHGGSAGWGLVFSAVFVGLAAGMFLGLRILRDFSRRRLFGLSIISASIPLALASLIPSLAVVVVLVILLGGCAGVAYVTGYTIVGLEVDDATRGRTFAFLYSAIRVILFAVIAVAPFLSAGFTALVRAVTGVQVIQVGNVRYDGVGDNFVLLLSAVTAVVLGLVSYRQMDDRRGVPLLADLTSVLRGEPSGPLPVFRNGVRGGPRHSRDSRGQGPSAAASSAAEPSAGGAGAAGPEPPPPSRGLLLALEGGEGAGKSTQASLLAIWLREQGFEVVATHEPGATKVGMRLRALLLDTAHAGLSARAETLMYAADRAEHVETVIRPALARGAIVVTDRYVDSSLAYQGAGREQPAAEVADLNQWATGGLVPDLTVVLDLSAAAGLSRRARSADRLEAEPADFHERVRAAFLALAAADPWRYLVIDATRPSADISRDIQDRVRVMLPDPVPLAAEETTGSFPAVHE
jgi:dTMP kinase